MRLASIQTPEGRHLAALESSKVYDLTSASHDGDSGTTFQSLEDLIRSGADGRERAHRLVEDLAASGRHVAEISETTFAPPLANPGQIIAVGRNYMDHASEAGADLPSLPRIFPKWASTIIGNGQAIVRPSLTTMMDWEVEMAVIIGKFASRVDEDSALDYVFGYTLLNDVSARDLQASKPEQLALAKNFRSFTPMGSWVCLSDEVSDPSDVVLRTWVNGELMQDASTSLLIFNVVRLVAFASRVLDLRPGDVISTGTPAGVGWFRTPPRFLDAGDQVRMEMVKGGETICQLANPVEAEEQ